MKVRLFVTDASDLTYIVSQYGNFDPNLKVSDITNDWVNVLLRETKALSVHRNIRTLNERDLLDTLEGRDIEFFEDELIHTIRSLDLSSHGFPTMHHEIIDNQLEFYILGG